MSNATFENASGQTIMADGPSPIEYTLLGGAVATLIGLLGKVFFMVFNTSDKREERLASERTTAEKASHEVAMSMVVAMTEGTMAMRQLRETVCEMNDLLKGLPCREYMATVREGTPKTVQDATRSN